MTEECHVRLASGLHMQDKPWGAREMAPWLRALLIAIGALVLTPTPTRHPWGWGRRGHGMLVTLYMSWPEPRPCVFG